MFDNGLILCIIFFLQVCISFGASSILRVTFGEFEKTGPISNGSPLSFCIFVLSDNKFLHD